MTASTPDSRERPPHSIRDVGHPQFTLWESRGQRVGSFLMGLFVLLAGLGLFGDGLLSSTSATDGEFRVEYSRFMRREARETLVVHVPAAAVTEGVVALRIDRDYAAEFRIEEMAPEPSTVAVSEDTLVFEFALSDGPASADVVFTVSPVQPGRVSGTIQVDGGPSVEVQHFVYP